MFLVIYFTGNRATNVAQEHKQDAIDYARGAKVIIPSCYEAIVLDEDGQEVPLD